MTELAETLGKTLCHLLVGAPVKVNAATQLLTEATAVGSASIIVLLNRLLQNAAVPIILALTIMVANRFPHRPRVPSRRVRLVTQAAELALSNIGRSNRRRSQQCQKCCGNNKAHLG